MTVKTTFARRGLLSLTCMLLPHAPALAEQATSERETTGIRDDAHLAKLERTKDTAAVVARKRKETEKAAWFWGGSLTSMWRSYREIDNEKRVEDFLKWSWEQSCDLWVYFSDGDRQRIFVQGAMFYVDRGVGVPYTGIGADAEGPVLENAGYELELFREPQIPMTITLGRQFFLIGNGVVYSAWDDGLLLKDRLGDFRQKHFVARTAPHTENIDFSVPGFDKSSDRLFLATETAYLGIEDAVLYVYGLSQQDASSEDPEDPHQQYDYDSCYAGLGFLWKLPSKTELSGEWIYEGGRSFTDATGTIGKRTDIEAEAVVAGIKQYVAAELRPIIEAGYGYGSGDEDRSSVTNVIGGDLDGTDKNFLGFGYYLAGYAFQPRLSNIHVFSVGVSLEPLRSSSVGSIAIGSRYYLYRKAREAGGTSDFESDQENGELGDEADLFVHWKFRENLAANVRYGIFMPGQSFAETSRDDTEYFSVGGSLSF